MPQAFQRMTSLMTTPGMAVTRTAGSWREAQSEPIEEEAVGEWRTGTCWSRSEERKARSRWEQMICQSIRKRSETRMMEHDGERAV
ncbi:hypothetical protein N656DRAFT_70082 [Canariomyces notabilis]|uniref:Uncharacterized protein n=1 Tax=Canariomyces notabilis TaxID=2074819 RepID=A0AAN6TDY4_9PEZI|nr:hypothetical protein N656DRAFT_70082 [Canariomyces arenarius]